MTPYVFRKYPGYNLNEIKCWSVSTVIDTKNFDVEDIVYSKGSAKAGTSIPSPLARLELFDTAFHIVGTDQKNNLDGTTIYHQLVSDCLDMLQLIFNLKNKEIGLNKTLWFREWKVKENIDRLKGHGESHAHYILGKSLEQVFFDKIGSAFTGTHSIFLLYYENKLMGGTSPLTLFFTSPNWSRYIKDGLILNIPRSTDGDTFFDDKFCPLYKRDKTFVEYLYKLLVFNRKSFEKAEGLRKYIYRTIDLYFSDLKIAMDLNQPTVLQEKSDSAGPSAGGDMDEEYSKVNTGIDNKFLTVNGLYFYCQKEGSGQIKVERTSDFLMRASESKYKMLYVDNEEKHACAPLVLVEGMNIAGDYMAANSPWDPNTRIKDLYHRDVPLYERKLPQGNSQSITYPFVTVDDFLEDVLIEVPFNINNSRFFSGCKGDFNYLLPIKKEFFNFFNFSDLRNNLSTSIDDGAVKIMLKIPIRNRKRVDYITFSRTYRVADNTIIVCRCNVGIFPFYQLNDQDTKLSTLNDYTVLLANSVETDLKDERLTLKFFNYRGLVSEHNSIGKQMLPRSVFRQNGATATSKYYRLKEVFDYIELSYQFTPQGNKCTGLILPNFENRQFSSSNLLKAFTFALDFGTSNTHIAYKEDNDSGLPKSFEIEEVDQQMVLLNEPGPDSDIGVRFESYGQFPGIDLTLRREFLPLVITRKSKSTISFPFKTASCEVTEFSSIDKSKVGLFSHINIGYYIDREEKQDNIIYTTNLKWLLEYNNDDVNQSRVKFFLKQLMLQIKAKAILNNGKPSDLKIVWSVPLSMARGNRVGLEKVLKEAFREVFDQCGAKLMSPVPESIAPYFYLTQSGSGIQEIANVINVDIGGGTTDIMMFMESSGNRQDKYLSTSFRFAGSDLWGSGFKGKLKDNGFIQNYLAYQKENSINPDELKYFHKVRMDGNLSADDLVSFLFRYDDSFKFSDSITIGKPGLLLILYLHYSAIIYHILQIIEVKKYPLPRYLSFTGKGSQYIKLICGGNERELEDYTRLLVRSYTGGQTLQDSFKIHLNDNPKEITANGSVLYALADNKERSKYEPKDVHFGFVHPGGDSVGDSTSDTELASSRGCSIAVKDLRDTNSPINISVLNNLNRFIEKTLGNNEIVSYLNEFKVENPKVISDQLKWSGDMDNGEGLLYDSYRKVLKDLQSPDKEEAVLTESLFFYGLKDALYQLSKHIVRDKTA